MIQTTPLIWQVVHHNRPRQLTLLTFYVKCKCSFSKFGRLVRYLNLWWMRGLSTCSTLEPGLSILSMRLRSEEQEPGRLYVAWRKWASLQYRVISKIGSSLLPDNREAWAMSVKDEKALDGIYTKRLRVAHELRLPVTISPRMTIVNLWSQTQYQMEQRHLVWFGSDVDSTVM